MVPGYLPQLTLKFQGGAKCVLGGSELNLKNVLFAQKSTFGDGLLLFGPLFFEPFFQSAPGIDFGLILGSPTPQNRAGA